MSLNPVIIIPAIGQSKLFVADENGDRIKSAWPVELDEKALLEEMKGSLMKMMLFRKDAGFSDKVKDILDELTQPLSVDENGNPVNNIKTVICPESFAECGEDEQKFIKNSFPVDSIAGKIGEDKIFYFDYNFFGDISLTAKALDGLVGEVKTKTGYEKVDFIVFSTGAVIFKAWLKEFAVKSDAERVVFVAACLDGASVVADVYENKLQLDNPAELLSSVGGKAQSLASVVGMLPPEVIENVITKSTDVLRNNIFGSSTYLWALIPTDRFADIASQYNMTEELRAKVTSMYEYTLGLADEFRSLAGKGMRFAFVCGKGNGLPSVFESAGIDSDGILDTSSASLGGAFENDTLYVDGLKHFGAMKNDATVAFIEKFLG